MVDGIVLEQNIFTPANNEGDPIFRDSRQVQVASQPQTHPRPLGGAGIIHLLRVFAPMTKVHLQHTCRQKIQALAPSS